MSRTALKIVSGGQTGVDRGALDGALAGGAACGGWCPPGRTAEDGVIPDRYPLAELADGHYRERTLRNVLDSDATAVLYFGILEGGTEVTVRFCRERDKPHLLIDGRRTPAAEATAMIAAFVLRHGVRILNVAGPRASKAPEAYDYARGVIERLVAPRGA